MLLVGRRTVANEPAVTVAPVRVDRATEDTAHGMTRVDFTAITATPQPRRNVPFVARPAKLPVGEVVATLQPFSAQTVNQLVVGQTWTGEALSAFVETQAWPREQLIIFVCHHGVRSLDAAAYFAGYGLENARTLRGGIDAWSSDVDPSLPRYELA